MTQSFKLYRIVCTLTGKALVSGSDCPTISRHDGSPGWWHRRGSWSDAGAFWKKEATVRRHLQCLCHDWVARSRPSYYPRYERERHYWHEALPGSADWARLQHLRVEQIYVTKHTTTTLLASDFMGIPETLPSSSPERTTP